MEFSKEEIEYLTSLIDEHIQWLDGVDCPVSISALEKLTASEGGE